MCYQRITQLGCFFISWFLSHELATPLPAAETTSRTGRTAEVRGSSTGPQATLVDGQIVLENNNLRAVFSPQSGSLVSLVSKQTGWEVQRRPELGRNFRMLVPLPERRNNQVLGNEQKAPRVHLDPETHSVSFTWQGLGSEHADDLNIQFVGTVRITERHLEFKAKVSNQSGHTIETIDWPYLGEISLPPRATHFDHLRLSYCGMLKSPLYPEFKNEAGYWGADYPLQFSKFPTAPFVLADSGEQGLYMGYHDASLDRMLMFTFRLKPGHTRTDFFTSGTVPVTDEISGEPVRLELNAVHFTYLADGETQSLHPIVVQPYTGSWHHGADCYKTWRKTWPASGYDSHKLPDWARQVHSWQQIHLNSPEDELQVKYRDLVQYGRDCAKHGVAAIQLTGWTLHGQDRSNPSHDVDPRLGTEKDLAWAIDQIQKLGVKVVMFNKFTWADRSSPWFRNELVKHAVKDPYGDYYVHPGYRYQTSAQHANINLRRLVPMCPASAAWRKVALAEFKKSLALGADGMLYDENQHHGSTHYCFDPSHNHRHPGHIFAGDLVLARQFHQIKQQQKPDYLIAGEGSFDLQIPYYGVSYIRIPKNHVPLHRYLAPQSNIMTGIFGHNDRHLINQALMYRYIFSYEPRHYKGRLHEFPLTLDYGKRVDRLRRKYHDLLWEGEFRHTVGAQVRTSDKTFDSYSVFAHPQSGRRAVVVANPSSDKTISVKVELPGKARPLISATPEDPRPVASDGRSVLPPLSAVVFIEQGS
jgi:hypothetical protein